MAGKFEIWRLKLRDFFLSSFFFGETEICNFQTLNEEKKSRENVEALIFMWTQKVQICFEEENYWKQKLKSTHTYLDCYFELDK